VHLAPQPWQSRDLSARKRPAAFRRLGVALFLVGGLAVPLAQAAGDKDIPDRLFDGDQAPVQVPTQAPAAAPAKHRALSRLLPLKLSQTPAYPPAAAPAKDNFVPPPGENQYYYIRSDGQPMFTMLDKTVNLTDALNRFYYNPQWRGEMWVPEDPVSLPEKQTRLMSTWREYNDQTFFRVGTPLVQFLERASGFGPGPGD